jgi:glycosyltransferase involved in cell wall biosynthesis
MNTSLTYIIVSPVKDEAVFIRETLESVIAQTVRPLIWIIRDDGSSDGTPEIVEKFASEHTWIRLERSPGQGSRNTGYAEVVAFNLGYKTVADLDHDVIVKLDGDLRLPEDYFENLLARMERDPSLGILSGVYCENSGRGWTTISMPAYHAAGASKLYRKACIEDIGGLPESLGWDSADEIKAMSRGWKTAHDPQNTFFHLKKEGTGMGFLHTYVIHGRIYFITGGPLFFFLIKVFARMFTGRPILLSGVFLLRGYIQAWFKKETVILSEEEVTFHRKLLNSRLFPIKL